MGSSLTPLFLSHSMVNLSANASGLCLKVCTEPFCTSHHLLSHHPAAPPPPPPGLSLTASAAFRDLFPLLGSLYPFSTKGNRILQGQRSLLCSNSSHGSHLTQMRSQNPHLSEPGLLSSFPHLISCYFPHFHPLHTSQLADL